MTKPLLLSLFLVLPSLLPAQKLLFHKNKRREAIYNVGDVISFQIKGSRTKITGTITGFEDSIIVFPDFRINPGKISHLYVDGKTKIWYLLRYKYQKLFLYAGVVYLTADVVNSGELTKNTALISGSLIAASFATHWVISDKIKIKGRRRIIILR